MIELSLLKKTKVELQKIRNLFELAEKGRDLLEDRLGTLLTAFNRHARDLLAIRQDLATLTHEATRRLILAKTFDKQLLERLILLLSTKRQLLVRTENIGGVNVPILQPYSNPVERFPFSISSMRVNKMIEAFDRLIELIIDLATKESIIMRIGHEIQKIRTRYNALDEILLPELKQQIQEIESTLEEKEREEFYKLRLFLKKKELQAETNRDKALTSIDPLIPS